MKLFAQTCEQLSLESSTLKKIEIISNILKKTADESELYLFCLYLTGKVYPNSVQKTINVGGAWVREATIKLLNIKKEVWEEEFKKFKEIGETVESLMTNYSYQVNSSSEANLFSHQSNTDLKEFKLADFQKYINDLSENSKSLTKVSLIQNLLSHLSPLEAKYAVKILLNKMRIGVQEATVEDSIAVAFEIEKKDVKKLNFYLGDIGEVALRSKNKDFENVNFKLMHPIKAMLASAEVDIEEIFKRMGKIVWAEYKYDGIRAHVHKLDSKIRIFTRDLKDITLQFPEIEVLFSKIPGNFLIDGEIVPFRENRIMTFADLQKRLGRKEKLDIAVAENPTTFIAYDLIYLNDEMLFNKSLQTRREILEENFSNYLLFSTKKIVTTPKEFTEFFIKSKSEGREGLMIKNPSSEYESGKRGIHWLKYKQTLDPLDVVVLKAEYGEGKNSKYLSNFTFGVWDEKRQNIIPVGRVYSGAKEEDLIYFTEYLPTIATKEVTNGFELNPELIFEVGFENVQKSERYISGYAVRFPRILRIRRDGRINDKSIEEINTIQDVERIWKTLG